MTLKNLTLQDIHNRVQHMVNRGYNRLRVLDDIAKHDRRSGWGLSVADMHAIYAAHLPAECYLLRHNTA